MTSVTGAAEEAGVPAAPPKEQLKKDKGRFRRGFQNTFAALGWLGFTLKWMYPPMLCGIAWLLPHMFSGLNKLSVLPFVFDPTRDTIIGTIAFAVIGLIVQNWVAGNERASLAELLADGLISGWWAVAMGMLAMWAYMSGNAEFYLMFPAVYSVVEMSWGLFAGFRNAYQRVPYDVRRQ